MQKLAKYRKEQWIIGPSRCMPNSVADESDSSTHRSTCNSALLDSLSVSLSHSLVVSLLYFFHRSSLCSSEDIQLFSCGSQLYTSNTSCNAQLCISASSTHHKKNQNMIRNSLFSSFCPSVHLTLADSERKIPLKERKRKR